MYLSIVTTLFNSAPHLLEFYSRIKREAEKITNDYEIIFVNDGSPDNSLDIGVSLYKKDQQRVRVVDLSRNFGHHKAMMTGLAHAKGDLVFLIDCDLEEEPELLYRFYSRIRHPGVDVVYGVRTKREGTLFERSSATLFWMLFNLLSSYPVPRNQFTARLMTQRYVASLVEQKDREIFLPGLWAITGFNQVAVEADKHPKGTSTYTLSRKIAQLVTSITSFSIRPLVLIFYLGSFIVLVSSIGILYLLVKRLFFGVYLEGWPSLIVSVWFLGGLTIFCLGLIGIYVSKIYTETKQRPLTVIRQLYGSTLESEQELQSVDLRGIPHDSSSRYQSRKIESV